MPDLPADAPDVIEEVLKEGEIFVLCLGLHNWTRVLMDLSHAAY